MGKDLKIGMSFDIDWKKTYNEARAGFREMSKDFSSELVDAVMDAFEKINKASAFGADLSSLYETLTRDITNANGDAKLITSATKMFDARIKFLSDLNKKIFEDTKIENATDGLTKSQVKQLMDLYEVRIDQENKVKKYKASSYKTEVYNENGFEDLASISNYFRPKNKKNTYTDRILKFVKDNSKKYGITDDIAKNLETPLKEYANLLDILDSVKNRKVKENSIEAVKQQRAIEFLVKEINSQTSSNALLKDFNENELKITLPDPQEVWRAISGYVEKQIQSVLSNTSWRREAINKVVSFRNQNLRNAERNNEKIIQAGKNINSNKADDSNSGNKGGNGFNNGSVGNGSTPPNSGVNQDYKNKYFIKNLEEVSEKFLFAAQQFNQSYGDSKFTKDETKDIFKDAIAYLARYEDLGGNKENLIDKTGLPNIIKGLFKKGFSGESQIINGINGLPDQLKEIINSVHALKDMQEDVGKNEGTIGNQTNNVGNNNKGSDNQENNDKENKNVTKNNDRDTKGDNQGFGISDESANKIITELGNIKQAINECREGIVDELKNDINTSISSISEKLGVGNKIDNSQLERIVTEIAGLGDKLGKLNSIPNDIKDSIVKSYGNAADIILDQIAANNLMVSNGIKLRERSLFFNKSGNITTPFFEGDEHNVPAYVVSNELVKQGIKADYQNHTHSYKLAHMSTPSYDENGKLISGDIVSFYNEHLRHKIEEQIISGLEQIEVFRAKDFYEKHKDILNKKYDKEIEENGKKKIVKVGFEEKYADEYEKIFKASGSKLKTTMELSAIKLLGKFDKENLENVFGKRKDLSDIVYNNIDRYLEYIFNNAVDGEKIPTSIDKLEKLLLDDGISKDDSSLIVQKIKEIRARVTGNKTELREFMPAFDEVVDEYIMKNVFGVDNFKSYFKKYNLKNENDVTMFKEKYNFDARMINEIQQDSKQESSNLNPLSSSLDEVIEKVKAKNDLFNEEQSIVSTVTDSEVSDLNKVRDAVNEISEAVENKNKLVNNSTILPLSESISKGNNAGDGYIEGILDTIPDAENAGENLVDSTLDAIKKEQDSSSPTKEFEKLSKEEYEKAFAKMQERTKDIVNKNYHKFEWQDFANANSRYVVKTHSSTGDSWDSGTYDTMKAAKDAIKRMPTDAGEKYSIDEVDEYRLSIEECNIAKEKAKIANEMLKRSNDELTDSEKDLANSIESVGESLGNSASNTPLSPTQTFDNEIQQNLVMLENYENTLKEIDKLKLEPETNETKAKIEELNKLADYFASKITVIRGENNHDVSKSMMYFNGFPNPYLKEHYESKDIKRFDKVAGDRSGLNIDKVSTEFYGIDEEIKNIESQSESLRHSLNEALSESRDYVKKLSTKLLDLVDSTLELKTMTDKRDIDDETEWIDNILKKYPELEKFKDKFTSYGAAKDFVKSDEWNDFLATLPKAHVYLEELGYDFERIKENSNDIPNQSHIQDVPLSSPDEQLELEQPGIIKVKPNLDPHEFAQEVTDLLKETNAQIGVEPSPDLNAKEFTDKVTTLLSGHTVGVDVELNNSKSQETINEESVKLDTLGDSLDEVTHKVDEKTMAFFYEKAEVEKVVDIEKSKLNELKESVESVSNSVNDLAQGLKGVSEYANNTIKLEVTNKDGNKNTANNSNNKNSSNKTPSSTSSTSDGLNNDTILNEQAFSLNELKAKNKEVEKLEKSLGGVLDVVKQIRKGKDGDYVSFRLTGENGSAWVGANGDVLRLTTKDKTDYTDKKAKEKQDKKDTKEIFDLVDKQKKAKEKETVIAKKEQEKQEKERQKIIEKGNAKIQKREEARQKRLNKMSMDQAKGDAKRRISALETASKLSSSENKYFTDSYYKNLFESQVGQSATATFKDQKDATHWQGVLVDNEMQAIIDAQSKLIDAEKEFDKVKKNFDNDSVTYADRYKEVVKKLSDAREEFAKLNADEFYKGNKTGISNNLVEKYEKQSTTLKDTLLARESRNNSNNVEGDTNDVLKKRKERILKLIEMFDVYYAKLDSYPDHADKIRQAHEQLELFQDTSPDLVSDDQLNNIDRFGKSLRNIDKLAKENKVEKLIGKITEFMTRNSRMSRESASEFQNLIDELRSGDLLESEIDDISTSFEKLKTKIRSAGETGRNFFDIFKRKILTVTAQQIATYFSFNDIIRYARTAVQTIMELDTALVDLQKTTKMNNTELNEFYFESTGIAKSMGVTTKEIIEQASAWSRLGYNTKDASETMAELSSQFASISPGMDIDSATDGLVSSMKAFDVEVEDVERKIMDNINRIGNTAATSNSEIVDMLTRSSAAMAAANNSIEETIALETAAVEITRNAETTGTAFKTIAMRIRGYDEETEELSDDLQNISGDIANLTKVAGKGGVSLFTDETKQTYKSTYQILKEISEIWDQISDKQQAELLEKLAGKRGGQVVAGLLSNFDAAEKAMMEMEGAAGSADAEMSIIKKSISFKLNELKETWVDTFKYIIGRDDIGNIISSATALSEVLSGLIKNVGILGSAGGAFGFATGLMNKGPIAIKQIGDEQLIDAFGIRSNLYKRKLKNQRLSDLQGGIVGLEKYREYEEILKLTPKDQKAWGKAWEESFGDCTDEVKKLANGLKDGTKSSDEFEQSLNGVMSSVQESTKDVKLSTDLFNGFKDILKGIANGIVIGAISFGIEKLVSAVYELATVDDKVAELANEASTSIQKTNSSIDEYKTKLEDLNKTIHSNSSTEEEIYNARKEMLDLQNSLVETFGKEAEGINLVTMSYDKQIRTLNELQRKKNDEDLRKFNSEGGWANDFLDTWIRWKY